MKKIISIVLSLIMVFTLSVPALAAQPVSFDVLSEAEPLSAWNITMLTQEFSGMSDDDFDQTIAELAKNSSDFESLKNNLSSCGVELKCITTEKHFNELSRSLEDSDVKLTAAVARRGGESYYHIVISLSFSTYERYPSSKDGVTIYFDSTKAQYVDYNEGTGFRLRSGIQATNGTLVFNFDDSLVTYSDYDDLLFYGAVYVTPYSSDSVVFGADYAHTYGDINFNVTGGSVSFSFGAVLSGSVTVNYSTTNEESMWQISKVDSF